MEKKQGFVDRHVKKFVILAVIGGATSGIFGSLISAPSLMIGFFRLSVAVPIFGIPVLIRSRHTITALGKKDWVCTGLAGVFLFGHFFTWYNAVKLTTVSSAAVLASLHPLVVLFCTIVIFKRKVAVKQIIAIAIALAGATILALTSSDVTVVSENPMLGNILAFASGICMGSYFQLGNEVRNHVPGPTYVFLCFLSCWICFAAGMIITGTPVLGYPPMDYVYMLGVTIVCQLGTHAIFNICLGRVDSLYVSTWETGDGLFSTILGIVFLSQLPTIGGWIGCIVTTAGLLMFNYYSEKAKKQLKEG